MDRWSVSQNDELGLQTKRGGRNRCAPPPSPSPPPPLYISPSLCPKLLPAVLAPRCLSASTGGSLHTGCDLMTSFVSLFLQQARRETLTPSRPHPQPQPHCDVWAHPPIMAQRMRSGSKCLCSDLPLWCLLPPSPPPPNGKKKKKRKKPKAALIGATWPSLNRKSALNMHLVRWSCLLATRRIDAGIAEERAPASVSASNQ